MTFGLLYKYNILISDPFSPKRNVARSMYNIRVFDYFYNCLRKACLYFSLPTSHQDLLDYQLNKKQTSLTHKQPDKSDTNQNLNEVKKDNKKELAQKNFESEEKKIMIKNKTEDTETKGEDNLQLDATTLETDSCEGVDDICVNSEEQEQEKDKCLPGKTSLTTTDEESTINSGSVVDDAVLPREFMADVECDCDVTSDVTRTSSDKTVVDDSAEDVKTPTDNGGSEKDGSDLDELELEKSIESVTLIEMKEELVDTKPCDTLTDAFNKASGSDNTEEEKPPPDLCTTQKVLLSVEEIEKCLDKEEGNIREDGRESSSESDSDLLSPVPSPVTVQNIRVPSPEGAEYDFEFSSKTLTDGKVKF